MIATEAESLTTLAHDGNCFSKSTFSHLVATFAWTPFDAFRLLVNERANVKFVIFLKVLGVCEYLLEYPF